jgi:glycosyltransferase involved in cell wall biosynthesis
VISLSGWGSQAPAVESSGAMLHCLNGRRFSKATVLPALRRQIKAIRPDLIQGWMYHSNLAALACRRSLPGHIPLCWGIRQSLSDLPREKPSTRLAIRLGAAFSRAPEIIIYNSQISRRQHEAYGYSAAKSLFIPNGFEEPSTDALPSRRHEIRKVLGVPTGALLFAHFGRFHPVKEHALFVTSAATCAARHADCRFLLAGYGVEQAWDGLATTVPVSLRERFIVLDDRKDIPELLQATDICVMTSRAEAFPNIVGEAMMSGTAVIATDVGDVRDVVGETGIVIPSQNLDALIEAMEWFILNREQTSVLGEAGRVRAQFCYSINAVVEQYVALYEHLLNRKERTD